MTKKHLEKRLALLEKKLDALVNAQGNDGSLVITSYMNGYILHGVFGMNETPDTLIIEDDENAWNTMGTVNYRSTQELLFAVQDFFTLGGSKHDKFRIRIVKEKQEKD